MKIISKSLGETEKIAKEFLTKSCHSRENGNLDSITERLNTRACEDDKKEDFVIQENKDGATVVGLYGDLGSGKTAFTQAAAKCLGVKEAVTSPTFVIEKIYKLDHKNFEHLIHIDAYRLGSGDELLHLGWEEIAKNPKNIIFIEWPERVSEILPEDIKKIYFTFVDASSRKIEIVGEKR